MTREQSRSPDLERLGVKRVSIGGSLSVAVAFVQRAVHELREHGTFDYAAVALSNAKTNAIMARHRS